jgi:tripartite-type tricarboxylate transporter receptor subunit TctC
MKVSQLLSGLLFAICATTAGAQNYPSKPINMIVSFPAGGASDQIGRVMAKEMSINLGQPMIVENVVGVGGSLGVLKLASANPDGYTITAGSPLELILAPLGIAAAKNKPEDVRMIARVGNTAMALVTRKDLGVNSVEELVAMMKKADKPLSYASVGIGSLYHLMAEKFVQASGAKGLHVPYNGLAPAITDVVGGRVDFMFAPIAGPVPGFMENASLKSLAVSSVDVQPRFPKLPTMRSIKGFEDYVFNIWIGIQTGAKVSDAVAAALHKSAYAAMANPETKKALEATGSIVSPALSLAEVEAFYKRETAAYQAIAKAIKLSPQ